MDKQDNWELVVGASRWSRPAQHRRPGTALERLFSGFGNISNAYCWQIQAQGDELFLGTFSWSVLIPPFIPLLPEIIAALSGGINPPTPPEAQLAGSRVSLNFIRNLLEKLANVIKVLGQWTFGFDLWKTRDGINWAPVSLNGLGNPHNYGVRMRTG